MELLKSPLGGHIYGKICLAPSDRTGHLKIIGGYLLNSLPVTLEVDIYYCEGGLI